MDETYAQKLDEYKYMVKHARLSLKNLYKIRTGLNEHLVFYYNNTDAKNRVTIAIINIEHAITISKIEYALKCDDLKEFKRNNLP